MGPPRAKALDCWRLCPRPRDGVIDCWRLFPRPGEEVVDCWRLCLRPWDEVLDCCRRCPSCPALGVVDAGLFWLCETSGRLPKFANEPKGALVELRDGDLSMESGGGIWIDDGRLGRRIPGVISGPGLFEITCGARTAHCPGGGTFGSLILSSRKGLKGLTSLASDTLTTRRVSRRGGRFSLPGVALRLVLGRGGVLREEDTRWDVERWSGESDRR